MSTYEERRIIGQIAASERWGRTTSDERVKATRAARRAWVKRFDRLADPDGVMSDADRIKAAEHLMRAHMLRMSRASAAARKRGKGMTPEERRRRHEERESARIHAAAKAAAEAAPPLTPEQKARLRVLLAPMAKALAEKQKHRQAGGIVDPREPRRLE